MLKETIIETEHTLFDPCIQCPFAIYKDIQDSILCNECNKLGEKERPKVVKIESVDNGSILIDRSKDQSSSTGAMPILASILKFFGYKIKQNATH